ncbi:MAG: hypothetical protein D3921_13465 [Candidatus Electrothrix sp. AW1]|nr:hypothetical protein [Candidatus Electrothrix sp. AX1]MCI5183500.1 hypothetical protein [Candidatus Electrothrix gigas]MCI5227681.1 hypothetical protein [Candidatus Electrothrix gigas]
MVKNIIYVLILAVIGIPSWQIGTVMLEKKKVTYLIQEQANTIKKYDNPDLVKRYLKENLELMGLPTEFSFESLERRKVKIGYTYKGDATIFGYTYYEVEEDIEAITEDGQFDR